MDAKGLRLVSQIDVNGAPRTMGLSVKDGYVFIGHYGPESVATSVVDVRDRANPRVVAQMPKPEGTATGKTVVVDNLLLQNNQRVLNWEGPPFVAPTGGAERWDSGVRIFDIESPEEPKEIGFFANRDVGVHRMTCRELPYVYCTGSDDGYTDQFLIIADLSDPTDPVEVGRWWYPGMWTGGGERPRFPKDRRYALHHAQREGDLLFCGWWDAGLVILDVSDETKPQFVSNLNWGPEISGATHSAVPLPGRDLVVVTDECIVPDCQDIPKQVRVVDYSDPYTPRVVSELPIPEGDFCSRGGRFGPHNIAEPRPYTSFDPNRVYVTYFNAGLRVVDLTDPSRPEEVAWFVPDLLPGGGVPQIDDVTVDEEGFIYLTDRGGGGLYVLEEE